MRAGLGMAIKAFQQQHHWTVVQKLFTWAKPTCWPYFTWRPYPCSMQRLQESLEVGLDGIGRSHLASLHKSKRYNGICSNNWCRWCRQNIWYSAMLPLSVLAASPLKHTLPCSCLKDGPKSTCFSEQIASKSAKWIVSPFSMALFLTSASSATEDQSHVPMLATPSNALQIACNASGLDKTWQNFRPWQLSSDCCWKFSTMFFIFTVWTCRVTADNQLNSRKLTIPSIREDIVCDDVCIQLGAKIQQMRMSVSSWKQRHSKWWCLCPVECEDTDAASGTSAIRFSTLEPNSHHLDNEGKSHHMK